MTPRRIAAALRPAALRPAARSRVAALLGVVLISSLTGCGDSRVADEPDAGESASSSNQPSDKPTAQPSGSSSEFPPGGATAIPLDMLTATAAGGEVDTTPVPLRAPEDVADFVGQFTNARFVRTIERRVAGIDVGEGRTLVAAVVSIGCEVPVELAPLGPPGDMQITAVIDREAQPKECFAPMTTVGLVDMSDALLDG